ncbi:hypothetical protein Rsub_05489 [Raphidocelis subcapitata]|uniref:Uncharacterized protein n=1 Tax=Raphidocelis subcapitata TaxID=307507 RepID=A0A2V0P4U2_9CHLO|nr:hypothetical protein Rsub_05489 [Raphidocelis subcapitata]|eukprot:GBF92870.1 hypothetical protein Rsub_05489 [Raphidocelis subcapitata]
MLRSHALRGPAGRGDVACRVRRASRPGESPLILGPRGSPSSNQQPGRGPPGLILPGQGPRDGGGGGGAPGRILLPNEKLAGGPGGPGLSGPGLALGGAAAPPGERPLSNRYRPPPGFMNDAPTVDAAVEAMGVDEMLGKLRARSGHWFQLARVIPALAAKGYDSTAIDEATGITPVEQNLWVVAATVFESLAAAAEARGGAPGLLAHFESGGDELLYHFRFLPAERRVSAAEYIAANNLNAQECEVLARSMKEWDRRPMERAGFENTAADCLAFKYMRDAIECRFAEDAYAKLDQALTTGCSAGARARVEETRKEIEEEEATKAGGTAVSSNVMLTLLRLSPDELGVRPVPQLSDLGAATAADLAAAPSAHQEGAFGAFTIAAGAAHKWVALPQWKALSLARRPVALPVPDCSRDAAVVAASQVKTDDEKRRMVGPGLLIVDAYVEDGELDPRAYYLVESDGGKLQLVDAARAAARGSAPAAVVLFLARPPARDTPAAATSELLQV